MTHRKGGCTMQPRTPRTATRVAGNRNGRGAGLIELLANAQTKKIHWVAMYRSATSSYTVCCCYMCLFRAASFVQQISVFPEYVFSPSSRHYEALA